MRLMTTVDSIFSWLTIKFKPLNIPTRQPKPVLLTTYFCRSPFSFSTQPRDVIGLSIANAVRWGACSSTPATWDVNQKTQWSELMSQEKSKYVSTVTSPGNPSYLWSLIRKHKTELYRLFVCTRERKRLNRQKKVLGNKISQSTQFLSRFPRQFQVRIHKDSIEGAFSFLVWAAEVPSGGACTVIGRTHSHLSLPSIKRGCSNLNRNNPELLRNSNKN